jgi:amidase
MKDEIADLDAIAQAELIRKGEVLPLELVDAAIARIEKVNPQLNAVITPLFDKARAQARSPLPDAPFRGVPFLLKDIGCASASDPVYYGMRLLRDARFIAPYDTYLAAKFRAAGFICVGKTNTPELGMNATTEPEAFGPTHNPWDLTRSTGGSSGGSAAAVSARMVAVAHANDAGGSIRIPASECGVVGLKPSRGRVSLGPDMGDGMHGLVIEGVVSLSVRDTAGVLDAIAGHMPGDAFAAPPQRRPFIEEVNAEPGRLRIGLMKRTPKSGAALHPDCVAAVEDAGRLLQSLGHDVEESHPAALDESEFPARITEVFACHTAMILDQLGNLLGHKLTREDVELWTWTLASGGFARSAAQYLAAMQWLHLWSGRIAGWWSGGFDLLLSPTIAQPPVALGTLVAPLENPSQGWQRLMDLVQFTPPYNVTGQPAVSLPLSWNSAGLPIGCQLVAAFGREDLLLQVAAQLERARPWKERRPPVCA